jgi:hypothetical protein
MKKNLCNVAIPGTGIPLSVFATCKSLAYIFVLVLYPLIALISGLHVGNGDLTLSASAYRENLINPTDWFGFWRLNCALVSYHASVVKDPDYALEDKLTFLQVAEAKGIPVSPYLKIPRLVCKKRNEEGGLGISMFSNAVSGGDWIIQEALQNDLSIARLLPIDPPLSTFRVITISSCDKQVGRCFISLGS